MRRCMVDLALADLMVVDRNIDGSMLNRADLRVLNTARAQLGLPSHPFSYHAETHIRTHAHTHARVFFPKSNSHHLP